METQKDTIEGAPQSKRLFLGGQLLVLMPLRTLRDVSEELSIPVATLNKIENRAFQKLEALINTQMEKQNEEVNRASAYTEH